jgi:hypothetical protein
MDRICAVCGRAISSEEQWFRVHEEYAHLACSEKYLKLVTGRPRAQAEAPKQVAEARG